MKRYGVLVLIFLLGFFLRVVFIGDYPVSLHRDEAFLGYNAYSIFKTGADISGSFLPIHLESFYFSPAGYSYFSIPFIAFLGLSETSVRLASVVFGSLSVLVLFFVVKHMFSANKLREPLAFFSAFVFAITPWHINLSRVATENVIVVFFVLLGLMFYFFYKDSSKNFWLILSFLSFGLTLTIYQAPRAFIPLFIPIMMYFFNSQIVTFKIAKEVAIFLLLLIPVLMVMLSPELSWRISSLSIFSHPETQLVINEQITNDSVQGLPYLLSRIFHNKIIGFSSLLAENFFSHLSFSFLFTDSGFPDRYRVPNSGLLYIIQLPFILYGLYKIITQNKQLAGFILMWVVAGVFGSALTFDDIPNLQRTLFIVPPLSILTAYGMVHSYQLFKARKPAIKKLVLSLFFVVVTFSVFQYLIQYYIQGKVYRPYYRQSGYEELVKSVNTRLDEYDHTVITIRESAPTIFFLFYGDYDPKAFQRETRGLNLEKSDHVNFNHYTFSTEECPLRVDSNTKELIGKKDVLYVNSGQCTVPAGVEVLEVIRRADDSEVFSLVRVKQ